MILAFDSFVYLHVALFCGIFCTIQLNYYICTLYAY